MNFKQPLKLSALALLTINSAHAAYLDRTDWELSASNNTSALARAFDGDDATRWTTGAVKAAGQYIEIDLGDTYTIDGIVLDSWESPRDYPEGYSVYASTDGETWGDPVAIGVGQSITEKSFAATEARYVRIEQESISTQYWWSIHEIYINEREVTELDSSEWSLTSSNNSDGLSYAIDGDDSTRWTTEEHQTDGQYLTIDLGESQTFDRIVLDSENSANDSPQNYAVYVSDDNSSWETVVYNGAGETGTTTIDIHDQTAQYIKIEQTGSSDSYWWSIHELSIYADAADSETGNTGFTSIDSLAELQAAISGSDGTYKMEPGYYTLDADYFEDDGTTLLHFSGDNNIIDLTDVTINIGTETLNDMRSSHWTGDYHSVLIEGEGNTIINGTFINTYPDGDLFISDFKETNEDYDRAPHDSNVYIKIWGDDTSMMNNTIIVRGSYPYGYGDMFGKGSSSTFGLRKNAGVQVVGDNVLIDGMDLTMLSFGHGIFMQGSDGTVIRDTSVQGRVRMGADMYQDGEDSLPDQVDYLQQEPDWYYGIAIVEDRMYNLTEDGIRAYSSGTKSDGTTGYTGDIYVENSTVTNMRNCFSMVAAGGDVTLDNVTVKGCGENGYSMPSNGTVTNAYGDAAYAHLIRMPYGTESGIHLDITVVEPGFSTGPYKFSNIAGSDHTIILRSDGSTAPDSLPVTIGYSWDRWDNDEDNLYRHGAENVTLYNYTDREVALTSYAEDNTVYTDTSVSDSGSGNTIDSITSDSDECSLVTPYDLSVSDISSSSATLSWSDDSENISHYNVRYSLSGESDWTKEKVEATEDSLSLTGLSSATSYDWQLRAICADDTGTDYNDTDGSFTTE